MSYIDVINVVVGIGIGLLLGLAGGVIISIGDRLWK